MIRTAYRAIKSRVLKYKIRRVNSQLTNLGREEMGLKRSVFGGDRLDVGKLISGNQEGGITNPNYWKDIHPKRQKRIDLAMKRMNLESQLESLNS